MPRSRAGLGFVRGAVVGLLALGLVACGQTADTGSQIIPPAPLSPAAGEFPEQTFQATAKIVDGKLQPDRYAGIIGTAFRLQVEGDGTQHTINIGELVDDTTVAPTGETSLSFTITGDPGTSDITLDGQHAGYFERQAPSGAAPDS